MKNLAAVLLGRAGEGLLFRSLCFGSAVLLTQSIECSDDAASRIHASLLIQSTTMKTSQVLVSIVLVSMLPLFQARPSTAQNSEPYPVEVRHSGDDMIGSRLVYQVKELIRSSRSMKLVSNNGARFIINIVSLDHDPNSPGHRSVYSVSILFSFVEGGYPLYLTSLVGYAGSDRVRDAAESLVATADRAIESFLESTD